jgi:hypothetical protein
VFLASGALLVSQRVVGTRRDGCGGVQGEVVLLHLSSRCERLVDHQASSCDDTDPQLRLDEVSAEEVRPIVSEIGAGACGRIGGGGVWLQECLVWLQVFEKPPHRVGDPWRGCVWDPYLERSEVVQCRSQVHRLDAMIGPRSAAVGWVPCENQRAHRCDGVGGEVM